jgi:hypothetical protein
MKTVKHQAREYNPRKGANQVATEYRIFGSELSPYSVKVRSYLRYKNIPYEWVIRGSSNMEEFSKLAKLPLIPR